MPRIRTVKPDICTSSSMSRISRDARLMFILLLTEADDEGRFVANGKLLAGSLYPYDDDVTPAKIKKWLAQLEREDMVRLYQADDLDYGVVTNFRKHQKVSHPSASRLPPPPFPNDSGAASEPFPKNSGGPPESFRPDLGSGKGKGSSSSSNSDLRPGAEPLEEEESIAGLAAVAAARSAARLEAEKRLEEQRRRGTHVTVPERWLDSTAASLYDQALALARAHPAADVEQLARRLRPDFVEPRRECATCGNTGVIETEGGMFEDCECKARVSA